MGARVAGCEHRFGRGQALVVPPGTPHELWNTGEEKAHALCEVRSAFWFEPLLKEILELAREGKTDEKGDPRLLQEVVLLRRYPRVTYLTSPPLPVLKALIPVLAPVTGLLGYDEASRTRPDSLGSPGGEQSQPKARSPKPTAIGVASFSRSWHYCAAVD